MNSLKNTSENSRALRYMKQLDGLRAIAVFAVLYTHYLPDKYWLFNIYWGGVGVRTFFILSGFLITGILLKCRQYVTSRQQTRLLVLRQFYIRRFLRIFPLFYLTLAVTAFLNIPPVRETFLWHALYLSNIYFAIIGDFHGTVSHFWSLAVEEQFYLLWPLVVLFLPKRLLLPAIIILIFIGPLFRLTAITVNLNQVATWVLTPGSLDTLGLGSLLAYLKQEDEKFTVFVKTTKACLLVGIFLLLLIQALNRIYGISIIGDVLGDTARGMILTWIVAQASQGFKGIIAGVLEFPPVVYLGKISYGIYVMHVFIPSILDKAFRVFGLSEYSSKPILMPLIWTIITVLLSIISWSFFEQKFNNLKKFFPYIN